MKHLSQHFHLGSIKRKVAAGFLLAVVALGLALSITRLTFQQLRSTVDSMTEPNEKLAVLNRVFTNLTELDQQQRVEAIRDPRGQLYKFQNQSHELNQLIDSLRWMKWDSSQQHRLKELKEMLGRRDHLFFSYLRLKSSAGRRKYSTRLDTLSTILEQTRIDTAVVSTQKKTITTTLSDTVTVPQRAKDRNLITKLFGKKKDIPPPAESRVRDRSSTSSD